MFQSYSGLSMSFGKFWVLGSRTNLYGRSHSAKVREGSKLFPDPSWLEADKWYPNFQERQEGGPQKWQAC